MSPSLSVKVSAVTPVTVYISPTLSSAIAPPPGPGAYLTVLSFLST